MSIGSVFSVARSAMSTQQIVIATVGHNIANAEVDGYSRQRVDLEASDAQHFLYGDLGTGVRIQNIGRIRDTWLDAAYRTESGSASSASLRSDLLTRIEQVLGEPSDTGLASAMDALWSSWSDLATQPTSTAARAVVQQRAQGVVLTLNTFDRQLTDVRQQTAAQLGGAVREINELVDTIAGLNGRIVSSEVSGNEAPDLRDQRDRALDRLSTLGSVRVIPYANGGTQVLLGNNALVDGVTARHVETTTDASGGIALKLTSGFEPMLPVGGETQTTLEFLNGDLADTERRLDAIASALVTRLNALHRTGQVYPSGGTPAAAGDFFDAGGTTARTITLSSDVAGNPAKIAAALTTPSAGAAAGPGNNELALAMAALRDTAGQVSYTSAAGTTETDSFNGFYRTTASRLGTQLTSARVSAEVHTTLMTQADTRRKSESGVNVDEELTTLLRAQQAYAAAAKVISVAGEMMKTLVDM